MSFDRNRFATWLRSGVAPAAAADATADSSGEPGLSRREVRRWLIASLWLWMTEGATRSRHASPLGAADGERPHAKQAHGEHPSWPPSREPYGLRGHGPF